MNLLSRCFVVVALLTAVSTSAYGAEPTKDSLTTVKQNLVDDKATLVDVRERSEWDAGHVSGAVFLPLSELRGAITAEELAQRLPKQRIVYTHCAVGVRSCTAADVLRKFGYDVRPLKPGYKDLVAAGFPNAK